MGELLFKYQQISDFAELDGMTYNKVTKGTTFTYSANTSNMPKGFTAGTIFITRSGQYSTVNIAMDSSNKIFRRSFTTDSGWKDWAEL